MKRFSFLIIGAFLALGACYYQSSVDLRGQAQEHAFTDVMPAGRHVFVTEDSKDLLVLTVSERMASARIQKGAAARNSDSFIGLIGSPYFPEKTYAAVSDGGMKDGVQQYQYYGFQFGAKHVRWIRPSETTQVTSVQDLGRRLANELAAKRSVVYGRVPDDKADEVVALFARLREQTQEKKRIDKEIAEAEAQARAAPATSPPGDEPPQTVNGYSVGDGVYVQGWLNDEAGRIQAFDASGKRAKVLRYSDGISEWVPTSSIISRGQAAANNVGRVGVGVAVMVCLFNPDACTSKK